MYLHYAQPGVLYKEILCSWLGQDWFHGYQWVHWYWNSWYACHACHVDNKFWYVWINSIKLQWKKTIVRWVNNKKLSMLIVEINYQALPTPKPLKTDKCPWKLCHMKIISQFELVFLQLIFHSWPFFRSNYCDGQWYHNNTIDVIFASNWTTLIAYIPIFYHNCISIIPFLLFITTQFLSLLVSLHFHKPCAFYFQQTHSQNVKHGRLWR